MDHRLWTIMSIQSTSTIDYSALWLLHYGFGTVMLYTAVYVLKLRNWFEPIKGLQLSRKVDQGVMTMISDWMRPKCTLSIHFN